MECIVLDYARTSRLAHWVRDEMREIAPRLYFGQAFPRGLPLLHFVLRSKPSPRSPRDPGTIIAVPPAERGRRNEMQ